MDWIEAENGKSNNFKLELAKIEQQLSNLVSSIANGNYSETIMKAISEKEKKAKIEELINSHSNMKMLTNVSVDYDWIKKRLSQIRTLVERDVVKARHYLRNLFGEIVIYIPRRGAAIICTKFYAAEISVTSYPSMPNSPLL